MAYNPNYNYNPPYDSNTNHNYYAGPPPPVAPWAPPPVNPPYNAQSFGYHEYGSGQYSSFSPPPPHESSYAPQYPVTQPQFGGSYPPPHPSQSYYSPPPLPNAYLGPPPNAYPGPPPPAPPLGTYPAAPNFYPSGPPPLPERNSYPVAPTIHSYPTVHGFSAPPVFLGVNVPDRNAQVPGYDPHTDTMTIRRATKGFGTNDNLLISTLVPLDVAKLNALAHHFLSNTGKRLVDVIDSETSSWFRMGLRGLALGPLQFDVELMNMAIAGAGTNETLLTELIIGRPPSEIQLLTDAYRQRYNRDLVNEIRQDLSLKTERMFTIALSGNRAPDTNVVDQARLSRDLMTLYNSGQGKIGTDEVAFCSVLLNASQAHLTALIGAYNKKYKSLTKVIKSEFSGHMRSALLFLVEGAKPKRDGQGIWRDAKYMEKAMAGLGTQDAQLVWRIVRAHWDPNRMAAIKAAYHKRYKRTLESRVAGETSGSYKKLMVALVHQ